MSEFFYCPQCGKKKLIAEHTWTGNGYHRIYRCTFNEEPKTWRGRRNWDAEKNKPCGLVIKAPVDANGNGRDAQIEDYDLANPLSALSNARVPEIQKWILRHDTSVRKKSIRVIYEGEMLDLVRCADDGGLGVQIYWKRHTYERRNLEIVDPLKDEYSALRNESSDFVKFRGFSLGHLFTRNPVLWAKHDDTPVFTEKSVGKRLSAKLVEFCKALEASFDDLVVQAKAERDRWIREKKNFTKELEAVVSDATLRIVHYNGHDGTAQLEMGPISPEAVHRVNVAFDLSIKLPVTAGRRVMVEPLKVKELQETLGFEGTYGISEYLKLDQRWDRPARRLTLPQALKLAKAIVGV